MDETHLKDHLESFYRFPYSPVWDNLIKILQNGNDLERFADRQALISHGKRQVSIQEGTSNGNPAAVVTVKGEKTECAFIFGNTNLLTRSNKTALQVLSWILIEIRKTGIDRFPEKISFRCREMVEAGLYTNAKNTARDVKKAAKLLTNIVVGASWKTGRKKEECDQGFLFTDISVVNGLCTVTLNPDINWGMLCRNFFLLPKEAFIQSGAYLDTVYTVCSTARQRKNLIAKSGYYQIPFQTLAIRLNLPVEMTSKNLKRKVWNPLQNAINDCNPLLAPYGIHLENEPDEYTSAPDRLHHGKLQVHVSGIYNEELQRIEAKEKKEIEDRKKAALKAQAKKKAQTKKTTGNA